MKPLASTDLSHNLQKLKVQVREVITCLRDDAGEFAGAKARKFCETSAARLTGLVKTLDDYEKKTPGAWRM